MQELRSIASAATEAPLAWPRNEVKGIPQPAGAVVVLGAESDEKDAFCDELARVAGGSVLRAKEACQFALDLRESFTCVFLPFSQHLRCSQHL